MIRRVQALNYRCLRYVDVPLGKRQFLAGPHGSGKSAFLDALAFLRDFIRHGLRPAVRRRAPTLRDLIWLPPGGRPAGSEARFELAVEFDVPEDVQSLIRIGTGLRTFRYEVAIGGADDNPRILAERGLLKPAFPARQDPQRSLFPDPLPPPASIMTASGRAGTRTVLSKSEHGTDRYRIETGTADGKDWVTAFVFGPRRSTLRNLPALPARYPMATMVRRALEAGVRPLSLDGPALLRPSPPEREVDDRGLRPDGTNLPWVARRLCRDHPSRFERWHSDARLVFGGLAHIDAAVGGEHGGAYLRLLRGDGSCLPSWAASEGTMRLLALAIIPHLPAKGDVYLVENPENGIHPAGLGAVRDALLSARGEAQVLAATHADALLAPADPSRILCFDRNKEGAADVVRQSERPRHCDANGDGLH